MYIELQRLTTKKKKKISTPNPDEVDELSRHFSKEETLMANIIPVNGVHPL